LSTYYFHTSSSTLYPRILSRLPQWTRATMKTSLVSELGASPT
jgi:hypothetical protein